MIRSTITREGWYYLLVLCIISGAAVLREVNLLVLLAGLMIGPLLFSWRWGTWSLQGVKIERILPPRAFAGESFTVELSARQQARRNSSWAVWAEDRICYSAASSAPIAAQVLFSQISPEESVSQTYRCLLPNRGRCQFGPLEIASRFPLGMIRSRRTIATSETLLVCPRLGKLLRSWQQLLEVDRSGAEGSRQKKGLHEGDYYGLREWQNGDSRRWIHWRTSAKLGRLAVRQFEEQRNQDTALLLDLYLPADPTAAQVEQVEKAISFTATALADVCRRGGLSRILLAVAGRQVDIYEGASSISFLNEMFDVLAEVEGGTTSPAEIFTQAEGRISTQTRCFLVSTRESEPLEPIEATSESHPGLQSAKSISTSELDRYFQW